MVTDVSALDTTRTRDTLTRLAHRFGATEVSVALAYPSLALDCPPFESLGSAPVNVVRDEQGRSWPFDYGNLSDESSLCFQGWTIPGDGLYIPSRNQQARWGTGLYVRPEYEPLLRSATTGEIEMSVSLVVGLAATDKQIEEAARDALREEVVVEHDQRALAAQLLVHPLDRRRRVPGDLHTRPGGAHPEGFGLGAPPHPDPLGALRQGLGRPARPLHGSGVRRQALEHDVLRVGHRGGEAPRQVLVVSDEEKGQAG